MYKLAFRIKLMNTLTLTLASYRLDREVLEGIVDDIQGLVNRVLWRSSTQHSAEQVFNFILTNTQMWHDVRNADYGTQAERSLGFQPLYSDKEHTELNPHLTERDYLFVFKAYMRKLASRKNEGSDKENWYKMQDELAEKIARWPYELRKEEVA